MEPPANIAPFRQDTPPKISFTTGEYNGLDLSNVHNHCISVSVEDWFATCIETPENAKWSSEGASSVVKALRNNMDHTEDENFLLDSDGWKSLNVALSRKDLTEDQVYRTIANISKAAAIVSKAEQTAPYVSHPTKSAQSDVPGPHLKPDGRHVVIAMVLDDDVGRGLRRSARQTEKFWKSPLPETVDTRLADGKMAFSASLLEFKKDNDRRQNNLQLLGGVAHLFYDDPLRRHVYGVTMEKTNVTLWRFDRGLVVRSERFDCNKHPDQFVRMLLFLACADSTQHGFDPTVKRKSERNEPDSFIFDLGKKGSYRTVGHPISENGAYFIISRGLRVWSVKRCDAEGNFTSDQEHVLKDLKRFLTIIHDECVSINGQPDETFAEPPQANWFPFESRKTSTPSTSASGQPVRQQTRRDPGSNLQESKEPEPLSNLQHHQRVHRRTLVKEKCITFYEVDNLKGAVDVMQHFVQGLLLLMKAGWLHRDISGGNCLVYQDGGQNYGKIGDLEYCKEYNSTTVHDPITGTFEFMAAEALSQEFIFGDFRDHFYCHFYHDLEAAFWLFVWFLYASTPKGSGLPSWVESYWKKEFNKLFSPRSGDRLMFLRQPNHLIGRLKRWGWSHTMLQSFLRKVSRGIVDAHTTLQLEDEQQVGEGTVGQSPPLRWPQHLFESAPYETFLEALQDFMVDLGTEQYPVERLETIFEREREQNKRRVDEVDGRDEGKPSKHAKADR